MVLQAIRSAVFAVAALVPICAMAQTSAPTPSSDAQLLQPAELDQLVAPIALYPDALLSEILMASTYPLEVVQAKRWLEANKNLSADQLKTTADKQPWDDSVKSLVATPSVLAMMNDKLDWTQKLGDAVLAQQADVMDAVQRLRGKAQANQKLASTKEQTVTVRREQNRDIVVIEPTDPNALYVPYYDPSVVYGAWPYADYPPYYFPAPGYIAAGIIATGIAFGTAYALGRWAIGGNYWGGGVNWGDRNLIANRPSNIGNAGNRWQHRPEHRRGVRYSNPSVQQRFGGRGQRAGGEQRLEHRGGRAGEHKRAATREHGKRTAARTGGGRHHAAARPHATGRAGAGHHAAARHQAAGRAGAGHHGGGVHRGGGRGGRRSDLRLKHDVVLLGHLDNGLGFYRFSYNGGSKAYVGVMAQEVQQVMPAAVVRGRDGYLRVYYEQLGLKFWSYDQWLRSGAQIPATAASAGR